MQIGRLIALFICSIIFSSFLIINTISAEDTIENIVEATFNIEFISGTFLNLRITIDAERLTTDKTYTAEQIKSASLQQLGALGYLLYIMLENQFDVTFKNAEIKDFEIPIFDGSLFTEELNVSLSSSFFKLDNSVNVDNFINGVLDLSAYVNYSFVLQAEPGWNNSYKIDLGDDLEFKRTTGIPSGKHIVWTVKNWDGNFQNKVADIQVKKKEPTTDKIESEDIFIGFQLDSTDSKTPVLITEIILKNVDIREYNILPDFISNVDYLPADGFRLFVENDFMTWEKSYEKTVKPIEEKIKTTIEESPFNQTLDIYFNWNEETTIDCLNPYELSNMNNHPPIIAILKDNDINLQICDISSRALFGLINSGGIVSISKEDINFGEDLNRIGYDYNITINLPDNFYLEGKNKYTWNGSKPISGDFSSDDVLSYSNEEKNTIIEIELTNTDLNLLSFFTGKTELTFGLDLKTNRNYNVTSIPNEFYLPEKLKIDYLSSDALRLCIEENVFSEDNVNEFLISESEEFEEIFKGLLPGLEANTKVNKNIFEDSLNWNGNISDMDAEIPVNVATSTHGLYSVLFDFSFLPPKFDVPTRTFSFGGLKNQDVTYRVIFPKGIYIDISDPVDKATFGQFDDGRNYLQIKFSASEANQIVDVSYKIIPSALFIIGIFTPCIISLFITLILVIVIFIIRKKRRIRRGEIQYPEEEDANGYENEDFYIPPPPRKKQ
ncbi:hypothetical protein AYK20_00045 [Thermoplasmatales archaeon SG8-52-1]|nr:MAG: hypothetical protein AYK20_00045 [Thermoplasmatales archaeon SG8-52-1]